MPPFGPIKRNDLIHYLRKLGFKEQAGRKHQHMARGSVKITLPNPHAGDLSKALLATILRKAGISREEWEKL